jgi:hypothetical protein
LIEEEILALYYCFASEDWVRARQKKDPDLIWSCTLEILLDVAAALGTRPKWLRDYKDLIGLIDKWFDSWTEFLPAIDPNFMD